MTIGINTKILKGEISNNLFNNSINKKDPKVMQEKLKAIYL